jgi:hypothetical protein
MSRQLAGAALAACLVGCFNGSSSTPYLYVVNPGFVGGSQTTSPLNIGATQFEVDGAFFPPGSVVLWNGKAQSTVYKDGTQLDVTLDPGLTDAPGTAQVSVSTPDGFTSNAVAVPIAQTSIAVSSYSPVSADPGSGPFILTVAGQGFTAGSQVLWNGAALATTRVSGSQLAVSVPGSLVAFAGNALVQVQIPCAATTTCTPPNSRLVFTIGQSTVKAVGTVGRASAASELVWDATHGRLFALLSDSDIGSIDPTTGTGTVVGNAGGFSTLQFSISDQDQFLYVAVPQAFSLPATRYVLPSLSSPTQLSVPGNPTINGVNGVAAAPGSPSTVLLRSDILGFFVADGAVLRPNSLSISASSFAWGFDSSTLYLVGSPPALQVVAVDASGLSSTPTTLTTSFQGALYYDRTVRRLYGTGGSNFDEGGNSHGTFVLPVNRFGGSACPAMAPDGANGKVFFACSEPIGFTLRSFDADNSAPQGFFVLVPAQANDPNFADFNSVAAIVRWGTNGLAVATSSGVLLYTGAFVR